MKNYVDSAGLQEYTDKLIPKLKTIFPGAPLKAATAAAMTDTSKVYVYTGNETGYVYGDWYTWNGTEWEDCGVYNALAVETDPTLLVPGMPADAKVTGDDIADLKNALFQKFKMYSCENVLDNIDYPTYAAHQVTFKKDGIGINISGTSNDIVNYDFYNGAFPSWLQTGKEYQVQFDNDNSNILFQIYCYDSGENPTVAYNSSSGGTVTFPSAYSATIRFRIRIKTSGVSVNKTLYPSIVLALTNTQLEEKIDDTASSVTSEIYSKTIKAEGTAINTAEKLIAPYNDCNTIPYGNIIIYVQQTPLHSPFEDGTSFSIMTYNYAPYTGSLQGGAVQIAVSINDVKVRYKRSASVWGLWQELNNTDRKVISALNLFDKIGIIGDSWSSGSVYTDSTTYYHYPKLRWAYIASKKYGFTPAYFTKPGATTGSWLTASEGLTAMQAATAQDLYICCLGINDSAHPNTNPVGNTSDMDDTTATSFYGNYGNIIRAIKQKAANAKIALALIPKYNDDASISAYNTAIRNIASHFSVGLLDTEIDPFFNGDVFIANRAYNHLSAIGYCGMAEAINSMMSESFNNSPEYWNGDNTIFM